jgi:hypothetical protein
MEMVEVAVGGERSNRLAREPQRPELQGGDDAVLSRGDDRDLLTCGV